MCWMRKQHMVSKPRNSVIANSPSCEWARHRRQAREQERKSDWLKIYSQVLPVYDFQCKRNGTLCANAVIIIILISGTVCECVCVLSISTTFSSTHIFFLSLSLPFSISDTFKWYYRLSATLQHMFPINAPNTLDHGFFSAWLRCVVTAVATSICASFFCSCLYGLQVVSFKCSHSCIKVQNTIYKFNVIFAFSRFHFQIAITIVPVFCVRTDFSVTCAFERHPTN